MIATACLHGRTNIRSYLAKENITCDHVNHSKFNRPDQCLNNALKGGNIELARSIILEGVTIVVSDLERAAAIGDLKFMLEMYVLFDIQYKGEPFTFSHAPEAAKAGHLHIVQWFYEQSEYDYAEVMQYAAMGNHPHIMDWASTNAGYPGWVLHDEARSFNILGAAASYGYFDLMKRIYAIYPTITRNDYMSALDYGNLQILQWMNDRAPIFDHFALDWFNQESCILYFGYIDVIEWLYGLGYLFKYSVCQLDGYRGKDRYNIALRLKALGADWTVSVIKSYIVSNDYDMVAFMYANGCPIEIPSTEMAINANVKCIRDPRFKEFFATLPSDTPTFYDY
jgi:hypothetical protein